MTVKSSVGLPGVDARVRSLDSEAVFSVGNNVSTKRYPQIREVALLLTKKDTASFFSVDQRTIDRWLLDGTLPIEAKVVIGGTVRFRADVLMDHILGAADAPAVAATSEIAK